MKDYDLNFEFISIDVLPPASDCLCSLISNDLMWVRPRNALKAASIQYNPTAKILKIVHHNVSVQASDFSYYTYIPAIFVIPFPVAITSLAANNYHLSFISKYGVFRPMVKQTKHINSNYHAYLQCDAGPDYKLIKTNPKECYLITKEYDLITNQQCNDTTIIAFPVTQDDYECIRNSFSFLKPCKEILAAGKDKLLVPYQKHDGGIFFEGKLMIEQFLDWTHNLLYGYEICVEDIDKVDDEIPTRQQTYEFIYHILANLKDEDKNKIYPTIINNPDAGEWENDKIKELVAKYLATTFPSKYVLYCQKDQYPDYYALALSNNKTLIKLNEDVYSHFISHDQNICNWAQNFLAKKYANNYLNGNLSVNEQNNLNLLKKFCDYFASIYLPFKQWMHEQKITNIKFFVINDYINHIGTLLTQWKVALIDVINLSSIANTISAGCAILKQYASLKDRDAFSNALIKAAIEFTTKLNF